MFAAGWIAGVTSLLASVALASNGSQMIPVVFRDIKIRMNGNVVTSPDEPFIYNDKTYVPLRFVNEILNQNVRWNGATNTIDISASGKDDGISGVQSANDVAEAVVKAVLNNQSSVAQAWTTGNFYVSLPTTTIKLDQLASGEVQFQVPIIGHAVQFIGYLSQEIGSAIVSTEDVLLVANGRTYTADDLKANWPFPHKLSSARKESNPMINGNRAIMTVRGFAPDYQTYMRFSVTLTNVKGNWLVTRAELIGTGKEE